jgi:uncharacterized membrane protein
MGIGRLEAFSDGVLAIIITIMVLEMHVPHGGSLADIEPVLPIFLSYILSFINVGIYWNNHHHMLHAAKIVNGSVLWTNTHLLFWLSLIPFASGWMGENHFATMPVALYGLVLLMASIAYYILAKTLINLHGTKSTLAIAIGKDKKGIASTIIYIIGIGLSFVNNWLGFSMYVIVALIWFIPDTRIENIMDKSYKKAE